jgi:hypothetical protein
MGDTTDSPNSNYFITMPRFPHGDEIAALPSRCFCIRKDPGPLTWPELRTWQGKPERRDQARVGKDTKRPHFGFVQITLRGIPGHVRPNNDGNYAIPAAGPAHRASAAVNPHDASRALGEWTSTR